MESIDIIIPQSSRGFDAWTFLHRARDLFLREKIGLVGIAEFREQAEFEEAEGEGNA